LPGAKVVCDHCGSTMEYINKVTHKTPGEYVCMNDSCAYRGKEGRRFRKTS